MQKFTVILYVFIMIFTGMMFSSDTVGLEGFSRPSIFLVNHDRVFVVERASIHIFSLNDFKLIKKFGKVGEGPQEFKFSAQNGRPLSMCFFNKQLLVSSDLRASYFDLDGNFVKEENVPVDRLLFPLGEKFVGIGLMADKDNRQVVGFSLHDNKFKSEKTLFLSDFELNNPRKLILPVTSFTYNPVYKNKIYVNANSNDFKINIYNSRGDKTDVIEKKYPKLKIPLSYKSETLEWFRKSPRFKRNYEFIKGILDIREYYPPIRDLQISDGFIYIITFKRKGDLWQCLKMDLKGNEKGETFIPLNQYEPFTFYPLLYSVYKGKIYTLVEDEDDEVWKIHVTEF